MSESPQAEEDQESFRSTMRIDLTPELLKKIGHPGPVERRIVRRRPRVISGKGVGRAQGEGSRFRELLDSLYDAVLVCDLAGMVQEANLRALEFLLYERGELRGKNILSILAGADERLLESVLEALKGERFVVIQAYCERKDGSYFPAEIAVNLLQIGEERLCFFVRDVTVRKQTEDRLRAVTIAVENAGSGILITDLDGRIRYANPAAARMGGYQDHDDVSGLPVELLFGEPDVARNIVDQVISTGAGWQGEAKLRGSGGAELEVEITAAPNRDSEGEMMGVIFSIMDISDRKKVERALREAAAQRAMIASIGAACHHLGQPATVLVTNLEILKRYYNEVPVEVRELLRGCLEAAQTFGDILRRLNAATEFRTEEYIKGRGTSAASNEILKL